ncbi:MAG: hypothetical protein ACE5Z5_11895 [Candidatus Bathyarchaeia archaeon]
MAKVADIRVRVTSEEKETAQALADYLYKAKKIESNTVSEAMRMCLRFTVNEVLKAIERERFGAR